MAAEPPAFELDFLSERLLSPSPHHHLQSQAQTQTQTQAQTQTQIKTQTQTQAQSQTQPKSQSEPHLALQMPTVPPPVAFPSVTPTPEVPHVSDSPSSPAASATASLPSLHFERHDRPTPALAPTPVPAAAPKQVLRHTSSNTSVTTVTTATTATTSMRASTHSSNASSMLSDKSYYTLHATYFCYGFSMGLCPPLIVVRMLAAATCYPTWTPPSLTEHRNYYYGRAFGLLVLVLIVILVTFVAFQSQW